MVIFNMSHGLIYTTVSYSYSSFRLIPSVNIPRVHKYPLGALGSAYLNYFGITHEDHLIVSEIFIITLTYLLLYVL